MNTTSAPRLLRQLAAPLLVVGVLALFAACGGEAEDATPTATSTASPAATATAPAEPTPAATPAATSTPHATATTAPTSTPAATQVPVATSTPAPPAPSPAPPAPTSPPVSQPTSPPAPQPTQAAPPPPPPPPPSSGVTAEIRGFGYPYQLTVSPGTTVTWINRDEVPHDVVAYNGAFASPLLSQNQSWSYTFNSAGTFAYYCTLHPYMQATVVVQ